MESERNILIIVQNLPVPFDRRVWQEATSLRKAGFGVSVICPKMKIYTKGYERIEGIHIYRYPLVYEANEGVVGYFVEFVYCWIASLLLALKAYLQRPFHAIHACNPPDTFFLLALLFRPFGIKFVFDHHDLCPELYIAKGGQSEGMLHRALMMLERFTMRSADAVIAVNQSHRDVALSRGGVDASKVTIIRSGPPRAWGKLHTASSRLKSGRKYLVVYLGEMCQQDGIHYLINAIRHYANSYSKDTLFILIGDGPDRRRLKKLTQQLELDDWVHFTGRVTNEVLWQYLATADLCVDPDPYTEFNNLSTMNKMVEYLAFGRPVVAFDLTEHRRTASDAALYVAPNDHVRLSISIRELLMDEERRLQMGARARPRFSAELAWENSERKLIALYSCLLGVESPSVVPVSSETQPASAVNA